MGVDPSFFYWQKLKLQYLFVSLNTLIISFLHFIPQTFAIDDIYHS